MRYDHGGWRGRGKVSRSGGLAGGRQGGACVFFLLICSSPPVMTLHYTVSEGDVRTAGIPVQLTGSDVDDLSLTFHVVSLPERGEIWTSSGDRVHVGDPLPSTSVTYVPEAYGGGSKYATFLYEVRLCVCV